MRKNLPLIFILSLCFITGYYLASHNTNNTKIIKRSQILLGTIVEIQVRNADGEKANAAINAAFKEIKRIDSVFTIFNPGSPLWEINHNGDSIFTIPGEVYRLMEKCDSIRKITYGAFDITLGAVSELWGFGLKDNLSVPTEKEIKNALKNSGWSNILMLDSNRVKRTTAVQLDFGAIVPGYAADKAVEVLKSFGIQDALVNTGGELKPLGGSWNIGIQDPRIQGAIIERLKLFSKSAATSGDYERYFEMNGKRYNHIINPSNGFPAQGCRSVTIIANDCTTADALATGVFVLGPFEGLKLIEKLDNVQGIVIDSNGNKLYPNNFEKIILINP